MRGRLALSYLRLALRYAARAARTALRGPGAGLPIRIAEITHPSQMCLCPGGPEQDRVDHQRSCAWAAVMCRGCEGMGFCRWCGGDGVRGAKGQPQ